MPQPCAPLAPLRVYGSEVSYFTGKLEAYLRYKEIPYQRVPFGFRELKRRTGVAQIPAVELLDGRWMTDTTPIIAWLETRFPEPAVVPPDPVLAFFAALLEDYADEWLWRPAMHYRWSYAGDAHLLSRKLADELGADVPLPGAVVRFALRQRQRGLFVRGDGVDRHTRAHVESIYAAALRDLEAIVATRPFLLGTRPSLADFGMFGPMFRHFGQDPTPSTIMRETAPGVFAWVARVWNARASRAVGAFESRVPESWSGLLDAIGRMYLPYLAANAEAWKASRRRFEVEIDGARYRHLRVSRYRVWCLEQLRARCDALDGAHRAQVRQILDEHGCWEPLWRVADPASGVDPKRVAPFGGSASMIGLRYGDTGG